MTSVRKHSRRTLATRAPQIGGDFVQVVPVRFAAFLRDCAPYLDWMTGTDSDSAMLVAELRRLNVNPQNRKQLKSWVIDEWLPHHPVKRGVSYWARAASFVWNIYAHAIDQRHRRAMAIKKEMQRIACADKRKHAQMMRARARRKARRCAQ
jgi:hypothetical protein